MTAEQLIKHPWLTINVDGADEGAVDRSNSAEVVHTKEQLDDARKQLNEQLTMMRRDNDIRLSNGRAVQTKLRSVKAKKGGGRKAILARMVQHRKEKQAAATIKDMHAKDNQLDGKTSHFGDCEELFPLRSSLLLGALIKVFKNPPDELNTVSTMKQVHAIIEANQVESQIIQSNLMPIAGKIANDGLSKVEMQTIADDLDKALLELNSATIRRRAETLKKEENHPKSSIMTERTVLYNGKASNVLANGANAAQTRKSENEPSPKTESVDIKPRQRQNSPVTVDNQTNEESNRLDLSDPAPGTSSPLPDAEELNNDRDQSSGKKRSKMTRIFRGSESKRASLGQRRNTGGSLNQRRGSIERMTDRLTASFAKIEMVKKSFGPPRSAHKGIWFGSALLGKSDGDNELVSARQTADNIVKTCPNPEKVVIISSASTLGAIDPKGRTCLLQTPANMVYKALVHSHDPAFFAYVTKNPVVPFYHMHVFSLKRPNELEILLANLPDMAETVPTDLSTTKTDNDESHILDGTATAVRFLGSAPVTSPAWWRSEFKMETNVRKMNMEDLFRSATEILSKPLRSLWGDRDTSSHLQDAGVFVTDEDIKIVDALSCQTTKYCIAQVADAALLDVPKSSARPRAATSNGPGTHVLPAQMRMSDKQRVEVMAMVKEGTVTVDDAVRMVLSAERDLEVIATEKIVCFCVKDPKLNTMHIIALLCTQADMASKLHSQITSACDRFALRLSNPFNLSPSQETQQVAVPKNAILAHHELDRNHLAPVQHLGNGEFGDVYLANHYVQDGVNQCAVKTLKATKVKLGTKAFIAEAEIQLRLKHRNVVECVGVCMREQPFLVVLEFVLYGDLKTVLRALSEKKLQLTMNEQLHIADEIASAMSYLTSQRIVHMDLALRNCLLHSQSHVKLADFGVAHVYDEGCNYYTLRGKHKIPFLSCPPETLPEKLWTGNKASYYAPTFNESTDIWSYGVVLWEVLSSGEQPYGSKTVLLELLEKIFNGDVRLEFRREWPQSIVAMAQRCFNNEPSKRPTFNGIREEILDLLENVPNDVRIRDIGALLNDRLEKRIEQITRRASIKHRKKNPNTIVSLTDTRTSSDPQINLKDHESSSPSVIDKSAQPPGSAFQDPEIKAQSENTNQEAVSPDLVASQCPPESTTFAINDSVSSDSFDGPIPTKKFGRAPTKLKIPAQTGTMPTSGNVDSGIRGSRYGSALEVNLEDLEMSLPSPRFPVSPGGTHFIFPTPGESQTTILSSCSVAESMSTDPTGNTSALNPGPMRNVSGLYPDSDSDSEQVKPPT